MLNLPTFTFWFPDPMSRLRFIIDMKTGGAVSDLRSMQDDD